MTDVFKQFLNSQEAKQQVRTAHAAGKAIAEHCDQRIAEKDAKIERLRFALMSIESRAGDHPDILTNGALAEIYNTARQALRETAPTPSA